MAETTCTHEIEGVCLTYADSAIPSTPLTGTSVTLDWEYPKVKYGGNQVKLVTIKTVHGSGDGTGTVVLKFAAETDAIRLCAATLRTAANAELAAFGLSKEEKVQSHWIQKLTLTVPLIGGDVEWDFAQANGSTTSLPLRVRVKHLASP